MKNLREKMKKQNGFTLIEMLIVVAIIAILIAVSIPLVNGALEKSRDATDRANERAAKAETLLYYMGTADGLTISGSDYVPGTEIEEDDNVYYDAKNGVLTTNKPDAYGQCTGNGSDTYCTDSHAGQVIKVSVTADGEYKGEWATP